MEVNSIAAIHYPCPKYIERPREELVERLTEEEKELLCKLFVEDINSIVQKLRLGEGKNKILLLTEPLCELDVRERLFRDCIEMYGKIDGKESVVLIKPHPRDCLNYQRIFPDGIILDGKFPMEIMNFIPGLRFRRVVSVFTVVQAIHFADEIVRLGEDFMDNYEPPELHRENERIF